MKDCCPGESYLFSAAQHEKIVEALPRLSGAKWRAGEKFGLGMEDRGFQHGAAARV
jgi:hypothetical protein